MKNNLLIDRIVKNYRLYGKKNIFFSKNKSINWESLINIGLYNRKKIFKINQKYIPIIVDRNIDTAIAIISVILSGKVFCPISKELPIKKIQTIKRKLKASKIIDCSKLNKDKKNIIDISFNRNKKLETQDRTRKNNI